MSSEEHPVGDDELQAWVDEQLSPQRAAQVERWLELHPEQAARFHAYRAHRDRLRELLAPKAEEAVPAALCPGTLRAERRQRSRRALGRVAAGVLLLAAGGMAGWSARGPNSVPGATVLATDALQAYLTFVPEVRHPVEVPATEEAHLVTWLSNRVGRSLSVPDLSQFGFRLIGGRLLPSDTGPAAQFMYGDDLGRRLTLYLRQESDKGVGFDVVARDGVDGFRWFEGGIGYVLLAQVGRDRLLGIAEAVYRQLPGARPPTK